MGSGVLERWLASRCVFVSSISFTQVCLAAYLPIQKKDKQPYIQAHFKEKFGRVLNHNQIRYFGICSSS